MFFHLRKGYYQYLALALLSCPSQAGIVCGLTFVVEGDNSADDSRTEEDELSDDDSSVDKSLELLTHSVTGVDIGSNGDSSDEEEEQEEFSQLYPDEHDYKDLGEMMFKK